MSTATATATAEAPTSELGNARIASARRIAKAVLFESRITNGDPQAVREEAERIAAIAKAFHGVGELFSVPVSRSTGAPRLRRATGYQTRAADGSERRGLHGLRFVASDLAAYSGPKCANCGTINDISRCAGCHDVMYCDTDCQREHWSSHKSHCAANKKQGQQKSPEKQQASDNADDNAR